MYQPSWEEVHLGAVTGLVHTPRSSWPLRRQGGAQPLRRLGDVVGEALQKPPCIVAFSGGRDSSAVLALARHRAVTEGLPLPVPVTMRYPGVAATEESTWQDLVINHLDLRDAWHIIDVSDERDLLGPDSQAGLNRHGLLYPETAHTLSPVYRLAAGGSVLTGEGGDEILGEKRCTLFVGAVRRRRWPDRNRAGAMLRELQPHGMRRRRVLASAQDWPQHLWLRQPLLDRWLQAMAVEEAGQSWDWRTATAGILAQRQVVLGNETFADVARQDWGVDLVHPFYDPDFVMQLCLLAGPTGWASRTELLHVLFAGLLPYELLRRRTKAYFNQVVIGAHSRRFAASWRGAGLDNGMVDAAELRRAWLSEWPPPASFLPLQAAWMHDQGLPLHRLPAAA